MPSERKSGIYVARDPHPPTPAVREAAERQAKIAREQTNTIKTKQSDAMREYIAGDAHAEMQTVIGLLRYYSEGGRDIECAMANRLADRLSRSCKRGRAVIGAERPEERCS